MQKQAPSVGRHPRDGGLRALVLRPAAVPVARVRRPDAAQAEGLPRQGPVPARPGSSPGGRRPDLRRPGRQGQEDRGQPEQSRSRRRARDRGEVRADAAGHAGDPAPEDAAGRDVRRADARQPRAAPDVAEGGTLPRGQSRRRSSSTRSSARSTRARARAFQTWQQQLASPSPAAAATSTTRFGNLAPFGEERRSCCEILDRNRGAFSSSSATPASGLRRAERARGPAAGPDPQLEPRLRDDRRAQRGAARDVHRAADVRARVARAAAAARRVRRRHRTRWSTSCARPPRAFGPTFEDLEELAPDLRAVPRPRPADHRLGQGPAGGEQFLEDAARRSSASSTRS